MWVRALIAISAPALTLRRQSFSGRWTSSGERIAFGLAKYGGPAPAHQGRPRWCGGPTPRAWRCHHVRTRKIYPAGQINAEQHKEVMHHLVCALAIIRRRRDMIDTALLAIPLMTAICDAASAAEVDVTPSLSTAPTAQSAWN